LAEETGSQWTQESTSMKPLPAANVPGKTEFERFDNAMRKVLSVSKEELLKREAQEQRTKEHRKSRKSRSH
jgi:hypothetical protein